MSMKMLCLLRISLPQVRGPASREGPGEKQTPRLSPHGYTQFKTCMHYAPSSCGCFGVPTRCRECPGRTRKLPVCKLLVILQMRIEAKGSRREAQDSSFLPCIRYHARTMRSDIPYPIQRASGCASHTACPQTFS